METYAIKKMVTTEELYKEVMETKAENLMASFIVFNQNLELMIAMLRLVQLHVECKSLG